jgi:predicted DsbA family dithiol-disulfide isomerase
MKIEIWSDIVCPFCVIGKRQLEAALAQYPQREQVQVIWHSFELDPHAKKDFGMDIYDVLSHKYGMSKAQARDNTERLSLQAKGLGLTFNMDKVIPTNSFDAHRLAHLATEHGKGNEAHERLFSAYFTEGKNISDHATLLTIGIQLGLDDAAVNNMLTSDQYSYEVRQDEQEAQNLGIRGVPFFLIDRTYAVSGAQGTQAFLETLIKISTEVNKDTSLKQGEVCDTDNPNC